MKTLTFSAYEPVNKAINLSNMSVHTTDHLGTYTYNMAESLRLCTSVCASYYFLATFVYSLNHKSHGIVHRLQPVWCIDVSYIFIALEINIFRDMYIYCI